MSLASMFGWNLYQFDVKTTFLNNLIKEEVYKNPSRVFKVHGCETHVCRLKKSLYGLKQEPYVWYSKIDEYLLGLGFKNYYLFQFLLFI